MDTFTKLLLPTIILDNDYRVNACVDKKPSTPWGSRAVPQLSTDLALHRLAMEFEWDPACSMQYGRRLKGLLLWTSRFRSKSFYPIVTTIYPIVVLLLSGKSLTQQFWNFHHQNVTLLLRSWHFLHLCRALLLSRWIHQVLYEVVKKLLRLGWLL